ncbi:AbgT family transporter [Nocardioides sp. CFH 31398]|uniref:AbgT family transporter n=1 Tax=Nocardioides sp. CFH 31398 TaxID=2919579 RepID=UPI001F05AFFE|nr:AbgT family transporter [Nocardioides sp. CFH 31398]MCH1868162.1 AbgT family transporter [Nocardioides sp. CFH 31398]
MSAPTTTGGWGDRLLSAVERAGNRLPQPFNLFLILFAVLAVVSSALAYAGVTVEVPGADEPTAVRGFLTGEGLTWFTANLGPNFINFPPLVTVVTLLLAIGIAERTGFLAAGIRSTMGAAPRWALPYAVGFLGVCGSVMSDSIFIVVPPLAALAFAAAGRHPMAGLIGGFAAAGAGYSTSIVPTSLDALFAGITNAVVPAVPALEQAADPVTPLSNYFFNVVSSVVLTLVAGFVIDRVVEPRLVRQGVPTEEQPDPDRAGQDPDGGAPREHDHEHARSTTLDDAERRGLRLAVVALAVLTVLVLVAVLPPGSPWRNDDGAFLPASPLLDSIVFVVFAYFALGGYVYGRVSGSVSGFGDVPRMMGEAIRDMTPFLVLAFVMGQFIALFDWSGVGSALAVAGADALESVGLTGLVVIFGFILLCSLLNLFIFSGSSMWTLMAAVFVPLLGILGYEPAFVQAAFRIGDSATQIITPLNPYMIVLLTFVRRYEPGAGLGTLIARMLPFVVPFWVAWSVVLLVFVGLDWPLGPGNATYLDGGPLE